MASLWPGLVSPSPAMTFGFFAFSNPLLFNEFSRNES